MLETLNMSGSIHGSRLFFRTARGGRGGGGQPKNSTKIDAANKGSLLKVRGGIESRF